MRQVEGHLVKVLTRTHRHQNLCLPEGAEHHRSNNVGVLEEEDISLKGSEVLQNPALIESWSPASTGGLLPTQTLN